MSLNVLGLTFSAVVFLGIFIAAAVVGMKIYRKVRSISQQAFGTENILEGFRQMEIENSTTPKSVAGMTSLYLPKIKKDFPEFQYDEMKVRAENALTSYLLAISSMNPSLLKEGGQELKDHLTMKLAMLREREVKETYRDIKIHRTEILNYRKRNGRCIVTFQSSLQSFYTKTDRGGKLLAGNAQLYTQTKYNVDVIYIQDRELVEKETDLSLGLNCPNCGAPISMLGNKVCEYCGTPIVELNIYAWTFSSIEEV